MIYGDTKISSAGGDIITLSSYYKDRDSEIESLQYVVIATNKAKLAELFDIAIVISENKNLPPLTPRNFAHMMDHMGFLWYKVESPKKNTKTTFPTRTKKSAPLEGSGQQACDI